MQAAVQEFDIVIAGGGMVGGALACALGQSGRWRVALLEEYPPAAVAASVFPDMRVSAFSQASQRVLQRVGAWAAVQASGRLQPYQHMQVWDASSSGAIEFSAAEVAASELGWIVENRVVQHALFTHAQQLETVQVFAPARLQSVQFSPKQLQLQLHDGPRLSTQLLIGADGARSQVRQLAMIPSAAWEYGQSGLVATVRTEAPHQNTAWQRFLPSGPLAFLPLFDGQCSIVWSCPERDAQRYLAMDDAQFCQVLEQAFAQRLGAIQAVGPRAAFPLRLTHAQRYITERIALVGDAAHTVHPLAGQGVNLGLLDAAALAEVLSQGSVLDPGELAVLRSYERWRKGHNVLMQGAMDGIKRLFASSALPIRFARGLGLDLTNRCTPLKQLFARQAMGLGGDFPQLAKP